MPLYDYKCGVCGEVKVDVFAGMFAAGPVHCTQPMDRVLVPSALHIWDSSRVFEHITDEPQTFRSKREMKEYCRRHGKISEYVEGSC